MIERDRTQPAPPETDDARSSNSADADRRRDELAKKAEEGVQRAVDAPAAAVPEAETRKP